jgi:hypothetical protein
MENVNAKDKVEGKKIKVKIVKNPPLQGPLYTRKEIREIVSEFVSSWIKGTLIIRFPTAAELGKKNPLSISFPVDPSVNAELKIKEYYVDLLSVCAGTKQATPEEQEKAITEVFKMLLMFRSANRIEGKIPQNDLETKIRQLEETQKTQAKLIEQITGFLFTPKTPKTNETVN